MAARRKRCVRFEDSLLLVVFFSSSLISSSTSAGTVGMWETGVRGVEVREALWERWKGGYGEIRPATSSTMTWNAKRTQNIVTLDAPSEARTRLKRLPDRSSDLVRTLLYLVYYC